MKISPLRLAEMIVGGEPVPGIKPAVKRNLSSFVKVIKELRKRAIEVKLVAKSVACLAAEHLVSGSGCRGTHRAMYRAHGLRRTFAKNSIGFRFSLGERPGVGESRG
jgi:hypothetical protein